MSDWNGPVPGYKDMRTRNKGAMRRVRVRKRQEAEERNKRTPIERTARFRRQSPEVQQKWLEEANGISEG